MSWIQVGALADFMEGTATEVVVADRVIAICNVQGSLCALDGVCPHQGGPLGKGSLDDDGILTCPWHGWQFHVRDGQCLLSPAVTQPPLRVRVDPPGEVWVSLEDDSP